MISSIQRSLSAAVIVPVLAVLVIPTFGPAQTEAGIVPRHLFPSDVGSDSPSFFSTSPVLDPASCFNGAYTNFRTVSFNTDLNGVPFADGQFVNTQFASIGVTMDDGLGNGILLEDSIFGSNQYGGSPALATISGVQIYNFSTPVLAVGIINTSPDGDRVELWSGPNATGTLLFGFNDAGMSTTDRFVGGYSDDGTDLIRSFRLITPGGTSLELDELVFAPAVVPEPGSMALLLIGGVAISWRQLCRRKMGALPSELTREEAVRL